MVGAYFADMRSVLATIGKHISMRGEVWMVVGDSRYANVDVPVAHILSELAASHHWQVLQSDPIRHMRSSAQQGGRPELAESLIRLRRVQ